ncbi:MAG: RNA polymerase sigma factor, partial [Candidatus Dormibacteria bacterium]
MIASTALQGAVRPGPEGVGVVDERLPFEEVYRRHADAVYRFCLSQLGNRAAAEDVAADTFSSAFAAYERVQPDEAGLRPWLFRIARNAGIDHGRRHRRLGFLFGRLGRAQAPPPDVESLAGLRAELRDVLSAMAALGARDRSLVGLRIAGGLSYSEIAEAMGMSEGAARTATHRALGRVRAWVEGN